MKHWWTAIAALVAATPALAQDDPRFCPTRPSLGSSACTTEPGHVHLEFSGLDWQRDDQDDQREDRVLTADLLARIGVGPQTEVQIGWTGFGHVRTRDKLGGGVETVEGVGDVRLAVRQNVSHPDGKGLSFGIEPFVVLPVGRTPVGDATWSAGAVLPVSYDLSDKVNLAFTGQIAAQADEDGRGRHGDYSGIVGLGVALSKQVTWVSEVSVERDEDPSGHTTPTLFAQSIAWQPTNRLQLDLLGAVGLNRDAPDSRIVVGGAVLF